ncbi:hypothetical protein BKA61DRAFT_571675 [Leptodontidium sp. MPI-SDFR-AT-0119]|nr:hypothetical protein BKA61DRAFT_571675 [Leptodontidium sp. MPI-SDFR-AT-0119]
MKYEYNGPPAYLMNPNRTDPYANPNNVVQDPDGTNRVINQPRPPRPPLTRRPPYSRLLPHPDNVVQESGGLSRNNMNHPAPPHPLSTHPQPYSNFLPREAYPDKNVQAPNGMSRVINDWNPSRPPVTQRQPYSSFLPPDAYSDDVFHGPDGTNRVNTNHPPPPRGPFSRHLPYSSSLPSASHSDIGLHGPSGMNRVTVEHPPPPQTPLNRRPPYSGLLPPDSSPYAPLSASTYAPTYTPSHAPSYAPPFAPSHAPPYVNPYAHPYVPPSTHSSFQQHTSDIPTTWEKQHRGISGKNAEQYGKAEDKTKKRGRGRPRKHKDESQGKISPRMSPYGRIAQLIRAPESECASRVLAEDEVDEQSDVVELTAEEVLKNMKEKQQRTKDEFLQRKEERRLRDEEEHYQGLKNFNGSQRGWDGERESLRQESYLPESEETKVTRMKKKRGRLRKIVVQTPSLVLEPPHVTSKQLREDMDNFRTRMALDVIAIEDAAAESARKQRQYSATIKWDYDWISQGGLRNDSSNKAPSQPRRSRPSYRRGRVKEPSPLNAPEPPEDTNDLDYKP